MANATSLFAVVRMSFVSNGSLNAGDDAVHRHRGEIGLQPVLRVEFGGTFEGIGLLAERLAHGGCACGQRSGRRMCIEGAFAGDRSLAADVQRLERIELPRLRDADAHAHLRHHARIRYRAFHPAVVERLATVLFEVGEDCRRLRGAGRELHRRAGARVAGGRRDGSAVGGHEARADAVIGTRAIQVRLHDRLARRLSVADGGVDAVDGCFFDREEYRACPQWRSSRRRCRWRTGRLRIRRFRRSTPAAERAAQQQHERTNNDTSDNEPHVGGWRTGHRNLQNVQMKCVDAGQCASGFAHPSTDINGAAAPGQNFWC